MKREEVAENHISSGRMPHKYNIKIANSRTKGMYWTSVSVYGDSINNLFSSLEVIIEKADILINKCNKKRKIDIGDGGKIIDSE